MSATYRVLAPGDPAPYFQQRCTSNASYAFDTVAGRYIVLCLLGSTAAEAARSRLALVARLRHLFDDDHLALFTVTADAGDEARLVESLPGIRHFWDTDFKVSRLYGSLPVAEGQGAAEGPYLPRWIVLDPALQVLANLPFGNDGAELPALEALLTGLPPVALAAGLPRHAPVLVIPRVFDQALCARLIADYDQRGGEESGFMREVDGLTRPHYDNQFKVRRDHLLAEGSVLHREAQQRFRRVVVPCLQRACNYEATRMERYLVACYDAADGGHFRPHRDNTTRATAHRRFAASINLNDDFEGGELVFPEFSPQGYRAPPGAAVVFSGSLLHAVRPVTRGRRMAFLPFLYDDAAARVREDNARYLSADVIRR